MNFLRDHLARKTLTLTNPYDSTTTTMPISHSDNATEIIAAQLHRWKTERGTTYPDSYSELPLWERISKALFGRWAASVVSYLVQMADVQARLRDVIWPEEWTFRVMLKTVVFMVLPVAWMVLKIGGLRRRKELVFQLAEEEGEGPVFRFGEEFEEEKVQMPGLRRGQKRASIGRVASSSSKSSSEQGIQYPHGIHADINVNRPASSETDTAHMRSIHDSIHTWANARSYETLLSHNRSFLADQLSWAPYLQHSSASSWPYTSSLKTLNARGIFTMGVTSGGTRKKWGPLGWRRIHSRAYIDFIVPVTLNHWTQGGFSEAQTFLRMLQERAVEQNWGVTIRDSAAASAEGKTRMSMVDGMRPPRSPLAWMEKRLLPWAWVTRMSRRVFGWLYIQDVNTVDRGRDSPVEWTNWGERWNTWPSRVPLSREGDESSLQEATPQHGLKPSHVLDLENTPRVLFSHPLFLVRVEARDTSPRRLDIEILEIAKLAGLPRCPIFARPAKLTRRPSIYAGGDYELEEEEDTPADDTEYEADTSSVTNTDDTYLDFEEESSLISYESITPFSPLPVPFPFIDDPMDIDASGYAAEEVRYGFEAPQYSNGTAHGYGYGDLRGARYGLDGMTHDLWNETLGATENEEGYLLSVFSSSGTSTVTPSTSERSTPEWR